MPSRFVQASTLVEYAAMDDAVVNATRNDGNALRSSSAGEVFVRTPAISTSAAIISAFTSTNRQNGFHRLSICPAAPDQICRSSETNTNSGISLQTCSIIMRSTPPSSSISWSTCRACSPRISSTTPVKAASTITCSVFPSRNGRTRLFGRMLNSISDTAPSCELPPAASAIRRWKNGRVTASVSAETINAVKM